jgi:RNA polymerase sigma factor (TIGR02999 family)
MSSSSSPVTQLLHSARGGDTEALDQLIPLVYDELRHLARLVRSDRGYATINTTGLVHEAYEKLLPSDVEWQDRTHFFRVAARAMRQVLIDAARKRQAEKRGGSKKNVTFDEQLYERPMNDEELIMLDDALVRLARMDPRQARIVECRFFAGLTVEETAAALDISAPTVYRDWRAARAWLATQLDD